MSPKVENKPRVDEAVNHDLSKSSFNRSLLPITAAIMTLAASENSLAANRSADHLAPQDPAKTYVVKDTPKIAFYQVQKGDTLSAISQRFKVPQKEIRSTNPGLDPDHLRIGQSLELPNITKGFHIVSGGENPSKIAKTYGMSVKDLMAANPGVDPNHLKIGQALAMPAHSAPAEGAAPAPAQQRASAPAATPSPAPAAQAHQAPHPAPVSRSSDPIMAGVSPGFFASMLRTFGFEGGKTHDKNDSAHQKGVGVTNLGITGGAMKDFIQKTEHRQASNAEVTDRIENLKTEEAIKIYASGFWKKEFQPLGNKVAFLMFDWGVNSNPITVTKEFQGKLGVPRTGVVDKQTVAAVKALGEDGACEALTKCRKDFYKDLVQRHPNNARYLPNWTGRSDEALRFAHSGEFAKMLGVFEHTAPRGCDLLDPVREGATTLRKGAREPALTRLLQERLTDSGWTVAVDGKFGPEMERVIGNFKSHFGLPGKSEWGRQETVVLDALLAQKAGALAQDGGSGKLVAKN